MVKTTRKPADAKVGARQQCVYHNMKTTREEIYSKSTTCDFLCWWL